MVLEFFYDLIGTTIFIELAVKLFFMNFTLSLVLFRILCGHCYRKSTNVSRY